MTVATSTFLLFPPDRCPVERHWRTKRSRAFRAHLIALRLASLYPNPRHIKYDDMVCKGVIHGTALASCGTIAIFSLRIGGSLCTSIPSIVAVPDVDSSSVARILTSVVFPDPFLPMRTNIPLAGTENVTESRAFCVRRDRLLSIHHRKADGQFEQSF